VIRYASDPGIRRKGDVVEHGVMVDSGALRSRIPTRCTVAYVLFNDGSTYGARARAEVPAEPVVRPVPPTPAPVPATPAPSPIQVVGCEGRFVDPGNDDDDVTVGVSFRNVSEKVADVVKFGLQLVVQPRKAALVDRFLTQPSTPNSPAWSFSNAYGHDVDRIMCLPLAAHFTDGSVWP
jgi:hypothetical protein